MCTIQWIMMKHSAVKLDTVKGQLQTQPPVLSGSSRFILFRTMTTARNQTEPPVNRRMSSEVVPSYLVFTWNS